MVFLLKRKSGQNEVAKDVLVILSEDSIEGGEKPDPRRNVAITRGGEKKEGGKLIPPICGGIRQYRAMQPSEKKGGETTPGGAGSARNCTKTKKGKHLVEARCSRSPVWFPDRNSGEKTT